MQQVLHYTAVETGIYLIPYSFSILFISFVTGGFAPKVQKLADFRSRWNSLGAR
jgi:hypothetical protein